jgi:hypothetical protein
MVQKPPEGGHLKLGKKCEKNPYFRGFFGGLGVFFDV